MINLNIRDITQQNIPLITIIIFLILFWVFNMMKPSFAYTNKGLIREFGLNYKNKTIFPVWLVAIILAIMIYFFVLYYLAYPRINFKKM